MAYTQVNVTDITRAGVRVDAAGTAGVAGGDGTGLSFSNDGAVYLHLENTSTNTPNVILKTAKTVGGLAVADITIAMVSSQDQITGTFPTDLFNTSTGLLQMYFSGGNETEVLCLPFRANGS
jgi:hypothetical protein